MKMSEGWILRFFLYITGINTVQAMEDEDKQLETKELFQTFALVTPGLKCMW